MSASADHPPPPFRKALSETDAKPVPVAAAGAGCALGKPLSATEKAAF
jgi:hypothetical protein